MRDRLNATQLTMQEAKTLNDALGGLQIQGYESPDRQPLSPVRVLEPKFGSAAEI